MKPKTILSPPFVDESSKWKRKPHVFNALILFHGVFLLAKKEWERGHSSAIKEYTQEYFAIVKFKDREAAEQFYRRAMESSRMGNIIVRIGFVDESDGNFKSLLCPLLLN